MKVFHKGAIVTVVAELAAIAESAKRLALVPAARGGQRSLRIFGGLSDDIDNSVDGVRAPKRRAWAADHLDAVDVLEQRVLLLPGHPPVHRRINAPAVHHYQQLIGVFVIEAASGDRPCATLDLRDVETGNHAQQIGNARHSGAANVFLGDHVNSGRGLRELLFLLRNGGDLDVHEVFKTGVGEIARAFGTVGLEWRECQENGCDNQRNALHQSRHTDRIGPQRRKFTVVASEICRTPIR